jgi:hypothetical protein
MCYGDMAHGTDGFYEAEMRREEEREQEPYEGEENV